MASISGSNVRPQRGEKTLVLTKGESIARRAELPDDIKEAGNAMDRLVNQAAAVFAITSYKNGTERVVSLRAVVDKSKFKK